MKQYTASFFNLQKVRGYVNGRTHQRNEIALDPPKQARKIEGYLYVPPVRRDFCCPDSSVDGCDCRQILALMEEGKLDTTCLISHRYKLEDIEEAYRVFENRLDGVIKIAVTS